MEELIKKITKHYVLAFLTIWLGAQLLSSPETPYLLTLISVFLVHGWVYFIHRGLHILHDYNILDFLNTHMVYHHESEKTIPRPLELFYESLTDLSMNLSLILFQKLIGVNLIPLPVILLFTLTYTSIHIVNYSMFGSVFHRRHHESKIKNYAPDAMDHIFKTNYNDEYEDLTITTLNIFACVAILYPLRFYFNSSK